MAAGSFGEESQEEAEVLDLEQAGDVHLRFADGTTWGTGQTFFLPRDAGERQRFLDFLQAKTGKPILRARLIKDVPGW